jgi:WD40 repeat protein
LDSIGERIALAFQDGTIGIWDQRTGGRETLEGHDHPVTSVAFSPSGSRLASAGEDGTVRIWDLATLESMILIHDPRYPFVHTSFSADGKRLTALNRGGSFRMWESEE